MLWVIAAILLILWLAGVFAHLLGSVIHVLLVVALGVIIIQLVRDRRKRTDSEKHENHDKTKSDN
jgi:membrane protein implicated in regulation of membrane protease activity